MADMEKSQLLPFSADGGSQRKRSTAATLSWSKALLATGLFLFGFHAVNLSVHGENLLSDLFKKKPSICLTPACVHASSEILYNLSPNYKKLDPCTDFEELVCGGWRERHDLRADQGDAFTGTQMSEASQMLLRHILEAPYPRGSDHSFFSPMQLGESTRSADEYNFYKMKDVYDACMNEDKIQRLSLGPLMNLVDQIKAKFPVSSDVASTIQDEQLSDTIGYMAKQGITGLVALGTGADDKDPDTVVVSVSAPWSIGLPSKEYYKDEKVVQKYQTLIATVLPSFVSDKESSVFNAVVDLEKKLADASPSTQEFEDVTFTYNPMSIEKASDLTPQIGLAGIIDTLKIGDINIDRVIVMTPAYLKDLSQIINDTSREVLQSYFVWKTVQAYASYVEADAIKPYNRFRNELQGKDPESKPERWRTCVNHVDGGIGWILSRFFIEKAFSAKAKKLGDTIVSDIKTEFIEKLKHTKWMEKHVVKLAIDKVHNIIQKIGYPTKSPDIMNPGKLQTYYADLHISPVAFFTNTLHMRSFEVDESWNALGKPVDRDAWGMTADEVNAYYNPPGNEIVFPAGIMQFPVFDVNVPGYLNYGAFGSVAGHELSHAFDSTGRHYDQNGNYTDWWTNKTVSAFKERADCFVKQYGNYSIEGPEGKPLHINGRLTLGENIADSGGLSAAFSAWKKRTAKHPDQDLPGLSEHFTQDQLFFVGYSNWWCGKTRKETAINRIYTDPHAPKWARILGGMANSRDFRRSFQCESKKPTCELW